MTPWPRVVHAPGSARRLLARVLIAMAQGLEAHRVLRRLTAGQRVRSILGGLASSATALPLKDAMSSAQLGERLIRNRIARRLLLQPRGSLRPSQVYALVTDEIVGTSAIAWILRHPGDAELARLVHHDLVEEPLAAGRLRLIAAHRVLRAVATTLTDAQAVAVLKSVALRARQPTDPYGDDAISGAARAAFVDLLASRPELDSTVIALLTSGTPGSASLAATAELFAAALRRRQPDGGRAIGAALRAWSPSLAVAEEFLRAADVLVAATREASSKGRRMPRTYHLMRNVMTRALVVASGPIAATLIGLWAYRSRWDKPVVHFGASEAIAALTVLATVNVFTVQLSATRLPGPVARVAGQPLSIGVAYSTVLTVVALALFEPATARPSAATAWAGSVAATIFSIALAVALLTFAHRTDPAKAARAYRRATEAAHRATGRYLGCLQAKAAEIRDLVADLDGIVLSVERERVGRRVPILASRRGFLLPDIRRLRRLAAVPPLATGDVLLRVSAGIGTIVEQGEVLATLVPGRNAVVAPRVERQVRRALCLRRARGIDETTSAAVGLVALAIELAERADFGTSRVVAQEAALIVVSHVAEAREARRRLLRRQITATEAVKTHMDEGIGRDIASAAAAERARDRALAPVVPALRATIQAAVSQRMKGDRDLSDVPELILGTLLDATERPEAAASILVLAIPNRASAVTVPASAVGELLTLAAVRAMETADLQTLAIASHRLGQLHRDEKMRGELSALASVLTAICCWVLPTAAHDQLDRYAALTAEATAAGKRSVLIGFSRIGAAAILSGLPSVALRAAAAVRRINPDLDEVRQMVLGDENRLREETNSAMRGRYLGDNPSDALKNFVHFIGDASGSL